MSDAGRPKKRSFSIRGHRTSLSLETTFWHALLQAAKEDGLPVAALVTRIDANRGRVGLSSAIRVYLFERFTTLPPDPAELTNIAGSKFEDTNE
jgi:predicted DNA-binding ribbon-helix-helix protein